jgi:hypothetical protein
MYFAGFFNNSIAFLDLIKTYWTFYFISLFFSSLSWRFLKLDKSLEY